MQQIIYNEAIYKDLNPFFASFLVMMDAVLAKIQHKSRHAWATVLEKKYHDEYVAGSLGDVDIPFADTNLTDRQTKVRMQNLRLRLTTKDSTGKPINVEFNECVPLDKFDKTNVGLRIQVNFVISTRTGIISVGIA